jgi:hypothetical protein
MRLLGCLRDPKLVLFFVLAGVPFAHLKGQAPTIQHTALQCFPNDQFPQISAVVDPAAELRTCKVYFRSEQYLDFYYVEAEINGDMCQAVLPSPTEETRGVVYYIEVVDQSFNSTRTAEYGTEVASGNDCSRRDPVVAWFTGTDPSIIVGATRAGMASVPPGFQAAGIVGFVTAAGTAAGVGSGVGAGTIAAVGAGAVAAGAGVAVAAGGEESPTSTTIVQAAAGGQPPATTTTVPAASTTTTTAIDAVADRPQACVQTEPDPPIVLEGERIRFDATCTKADQNGAGTDTIDSYEWDLGDGRKKQGRVITPVYQTPGVYNVVLTVTDSGAASLLLGEPRYQDQPKQDKISFEVTVEQKVEPPAAEQVQACFTAKDLGSTDCKVTFDASCSTGPIVEWDWNLDVLGAMMNATASGPTVTHDWGPYGCSSIPTSIKVRLTVTGAGGTTDTLEQIVAVQYLRGLQHKEQRIQTSFKSYLDSPISADGPHGYVQLNGLRSDAVSATTVFRHRFDGRSGENRVVAHRSSRVGEGLWHFDFQEAESFVPGSIHIKAGRVVSLDAYAVVFRVERPGERVEFSYELSSAR